MIKFFKLLTVMYPESVFNFTPLKVAIQFSSVLKKEFAFLNFRSFNGRKTSVSALPPSKYNNSPGEASNYIKIYLYFHLVLVIQNRSCPHLKHIVSYHQTRNPQVSLFLNYKRQSHSCL